MNACDTTSLVGVAYGEATAVAGAVAGAPEDLAAEAVAAEAVAAEAEAEAAQAVRAAGAAADVVFGCHQRPGAQRSAAASRRRRETRTRGRRSKSRAGRLGGTSGTGARKFLGRGGIRVIMIGRRRVTIETKGGACFFTTCDRLTHGDDG